MVWTESLTDVLNLQRFQLSQQRIRKLSEEQIPSIQFLYEGSTREATKLYPRNVNVHAALALAGIGFDKTHSKIVADPSVNTNTHEIHIVGKGIDFTIRVSSFSEGGVSGKYVPLSACGSLDRVLGGAGFQFV